MSDCQSCQEMRADRDEARAAVEELEQENRQLTGERDDACRSRGELEQENEQLTEQRDQARETARTLLGMVERWVRIDIAVPGRIPGLAAAARQLVDSWEESSS